MITINNGSLESDRRRHPGDRAGDVRLGPLVARLARRSRPRAVARREHHDHKSRQSSGRSRRRLVDARSDGRSNPRSPGGTDGFAAGIRNSTSSIAFIRGSCNLCTIRTTETGRLDVRQSVVAVQGPLLSNWGDDESPGESRRLAVQPGARYVLSGRRPDPDGQRRRAAVSRSLSTSMPATTSSPPTSTATPLISPCRQDERRRLRAAHPLGRDPQFLRPVLQLLGGRLVHGRRRRTRGRQTGRCRLRIGNICSATQRLNRITAASSGSRRIAPWQASRATAIRISDFELANVNQAVSGATDNTDVGADLSTIRPISEPPGRRPPTRRRPA